jgi:xanthine dehydrogenase accessory factor
MNAKADAVKIRSDLARSRAVEMPNAVARSTALPAGDAIARSTSFPGPRSNWLQPMHTDWPTAVCRRLERSSVVVRVLVAEVLGSAPREVGACMLVSGEEIEGTIGGGNLEWRAIEAARALLTRDGAAPAARLERLTLGRELAQCCGGVVQLWIERFTRADLPVLRRAAVAANASGPSSMTTQLSATRVTRALVRNGDACAEGGLAADLSASAPSVPVTRALVRNGDVCAEGGLAAANASAGAPPRGAEGRAARVRLTSSADGRITLIERIDVARTQLWLYGAGHVGQALVRTLAELPFHVTWVDSRADLFPHTLPDNVTPLSAPLDAAISAPSGARHIVMTHDHALDYELCRTILARNEFAALGLIGSASKAARFRSRLKRDGIAPERIARLVCPIGLAHIRSKSPAAIAIGIAAQLLRETNEAESTGDAASMGEVTSTAERCAVADHDAGAVPDRVAGAVADCAAGADDTAGRTADSGTARNDPNDCSADSCSSCQRTHR